MFYLVKAFFLALCMQGRRFIFMKSNKKSRSIRNTKLLVFGALMAAFSIIIGLVCKNYLTFGNGSVRVTFENLPVILSGVWFGPIIVAVVGIIADLVSALLSPPYQPNPLITIGAAAIGILSGVLARYIIKGRKLYQTLIITLAVHCIGSVIIKSVALELMGYAVIWPIRIGLYIAIALCEGYVLYVMVNNRALSSRIERLVGKR